MNPMLLFTIARYGAALAAGFWLAWTLQGHQLDKIKLEQRDAVISQQRATRAALERAANTSLVAQNNATSRSVALRHASESAASELDRLRESNASAVRAAQTDATTCRRVVDAFGVIYAESTSTIQTVVRDADQCFSDLKLMQESGSK